MHNDDVSTQSGERTDPKTDPDQCPCCDFPVDRFCRVCGWQRDLAEKARKRLQQRFREAARAQLEQAAAIVEARHKADREIWDAAVRIPENPKVERDDSEPVKGYWVEARLFVNGDMEFWKTRPAWWRKKDA